VTPGFFGTMGIALHQGRDFTEQDDTHAPRVVVVNEAFARKFFPGENVIGKRIAPGATNGKEGVMLREIVGVVADAKQAPWTAEPDPIYYMPYKQLSWGIGTVVMRTITPPLSVVPAARAVLSGLDREAPMFEVRTGEERSAMAVALPRFVMVVMSSFAGIAMLLTVVGLYGVLTYIVTRRRREIGVRIALGAGRGAVLGQILREALRLVAMGLALGLAGAAGVAHLLASMVYGVRQQEPLLLAGACLLLVLASLAAAYIPAARAASLDPMRVLRSD
jgi:predicted permease